MNAILSYDYGPDVLELRTPHRDAHFALVHAAHASGELLLAGPVGEPTPTGAVLVFTSEQAASDFAAKDPYVQAGVATAHRVEPMHVVVPATEG
ncbi:hypothetical protein FSW04_16620 [Baekduia soli]|uniref:YCII-related domain-containing protein n=1 Tax=Baekduia soli TaxID=496014 RepID=A0A5B8U7G9_9ACTN|nr:YciI family protein [Baekduia soli]QEC49034.1 hypothetical protein FSW04_16620 [Baekduia soli]